MRSATRRAFNFDFYKARCPKVWIKKITDFLIFEQVFLVCVFISIPAGTPGKEVTQTETDRIYFLSHVSVLLFFLRILFLSLFVISSKLSFLQLVFVVVCAQVPHLPEQLVLLLLVSLASLFSFVQPASLLLFLLIRAQHARAMFFSKYCALVHGLPAGTV